jgi:isopenicillin N synthase-like dioxygenase
MPDFDHVPVIALGASNATREIVSACETAGFFYVVDHGVPAESVAAIFDAARWFFALPRPARDALDVATSPNYRGYVPVGTKGPGVPRREVEAFQMMLDLGPDDPDVRAGSAMHGPNRWPDGGDASGAAVFRATMEGFYAHETRLAHRLLDLFALGLGLGAGHLRPLFAKPLTQLRLLHYPPQPPEADALGVEAHTDPGFFTILLQDQVGGLELRNRAGKWVAAPPIPASFIINVGDMMQFWTGGRFVSTPHRVANRTGRDRLSMPFFVNPDYAATIVPLDPARGAEPFACGPYIEAAYRAAWPRAGETRDQAPRRKSAY